MKKITRALSMTLAAATALSTCICAYADDTAGADENKQVLTTVKSRVTVPEGLTKFSFRKSVNGPVNEYTYTWETPDDSAEEYKCFTVSAYGDIITTYERSDYSSWTDSKSLAQKTGDQLYSAAVAYIKKLNPAIYTQIKVDRDSIRMSLSGTTATFTFNRMKNGAPVTSDRGSITLDKNTGELYRMSMNWHPNATFKSKKGALTTAEAEKAYADLIAIKPVYVLRYDDETKKYYTDIEYDQTHYGTINAYSGVENTFDGDVWYDNDEITDDAADDETADAGNGGDFTPEELAELEKKLPYGTPDAVEKYLRSNKYLKWVDGVSVGYDRLYKEKPVNDDVYFYRVYFTDEPGSGYDINACYSYISVTLNAETGELYSYDLYQTNESGGASQYDVQKASQTADKILKSLSPMHYSAYSSDMTTVSEFNKKYFGSEHSYSRVVNGIETEFDKAYISLDKDMKLTNYSINFTGIDFVSPDKIMTEQQVLDKFFENSPMKLNYLVKLGKKSTKSQLIYSNDKYLRCNAFTGEPVFTWQYETPAENDLSGITDAGILSMAKTLDDNGVIISTEKFTQDSTVKLRDFSGMIDCLSTGYGYYYPTYKNDVSDEEYDGSKLLNRGEAMKLFTAEMAGTTVADLKGIFRSPFSDVKDDDPDVGYYAIAYALGAAKGDKLNASAAYTYGDLITLVYSSLTK